LKGAFQYRTVTEVIKPHSQAVLKLVRGYRSTADIVNFTRSVLKDGQQIESIQRHGEKPRLYQAEVKGELTEQLVKDIRDLADEGMESIGIICKTAEKSRRLHEAIKKKLHVSLLTRDDVNFSKGIVILPVYLAKGLEFDAAVVYGADAENYGLERDRKLFYTACTRALHRLHLFAEGELSPFFRDIPQKYYERL